MSELPPIYVTSPMLPQLDDYMAELESVWESGILTHQGEKYQQLESELRGFMQAAHVPMFANGHLALQVALRAYGWPAGSEIITTPFTFASTTMAIVEAGYTPVFCDVGGESFCLDPTRIEALITEKTKAILPVHVYGLPCDVEEIEQIARRNGLAVLYDAAHAFGESLNGKSIAAYGDVVMFSFHATKVFNTVEGGCLVCSNEDIYERVCKIRQYGTQGDGAPVHYIGTNAKMTEVHAAMGICNLRSFADAVAKRKTVYESYAELEEIAGIVLPLYPAELTPNYAYYPILVEDSYPFSRDELADYLKDLGIMARKYFFPATNKFEIITELFGESATPVADELSRKVLCLPIHSNMSNQDVQRVVSALKQR